MNNTDKRTVLILGANSDVAKELIKIYTGKNYKIIAASRSVDQLHVFVKTLGEQNKWVQIEYFDAIDFGSHQDFYNSITDKPHIVIYAAGFQIENNEALVNWEGSYRMMNVMYSGAVSILNIIAMDSTNKNLERIIGLSSLSGVRGRKSNFIYGSTKAAFTTYLAGLRQYLFSRKIVVNVVIAGYIRSKMTAGLDLPEYLLMEPSFVAGKVVNAGKPFTIVPGYKWKIIYEILKRLPENLVARLP